MFIRTLRLSAVLFVAWVAFWTVSQAWGIGFYLRETKDDLKLKYDVVVEEHAFGGTPTGRVTVVFTLADEGRLKPLDEVQLVVPGQDKNQDGGHWMDLVVSIDMTNIEGGKRMVRVHILKELAQRAEIRLNTHTMDGKQDPFTRLHHAIPLAKYLKNTPAAAVPAP